MTLLPGDVIATGTPSGIGRMNPGDAVEIKIEGIGTLRNFVVDQAQGEAAWAD
jgi:2-keto-4-pentenoate hydratase/2-oxohepta-3-ene-1,7-dioic acid hydratase in catechol pathway